MKNRIAAASLAISSLLFLSGCVVALGNSGVEPNKTTLGQQLIDLKTANDRGIISDSEYEDQKAKLLRKK